MKKKVLMLASVASMIDQFNLPNIQMMLTMGYEVHVLCNFRKGNTCDQQQLQILQKTLQEMHVLQFQWDCPRSVWAVSGYCQAYCQLWKLTGRYHYEWMHCHSPIGGALARVVAHKRKIPVIYTAHGFHFYKGAPWINWLLFYPAEKLLAYWTDILITVNREDYQFAKKKLRAGNVCFIPGIGINVEQFRANFDIHKDWICVHKKSNSGYHASLEFQKKYKLPENSLVLLSVGELSRRKNHSMVISALAEIPEKKICYIICGQGKLCSSLKKQAEKLGIEKRVRLLGYQKDIAYFYRNADIFVLPSCQEGMPAALMEAMAAGLPCVASDIRGNRELIDRRSGLLFLPKNKEDLKECIVKLLKDPQARAEYGNANQIKIAGYDRKIVARCMRRIYQGMSHKTLRISVLLAVYNPDQIWFRQLLESINKQDYQIFELIIMDDHSDRITYTEIEKAAQLLDKPENVRIYHSICNEGSDKTFEKLALLAEGDYIAFCDQDDIWEKHKLRKLAAAIQNEHAVMAYSDMSVIDEHGKIIYSSLRKMRKFLAYVHGDDLVPYYLADNCTAGCSMLVRTDLVQKAVPFSCFSFCDQWIAAYVSAYGRVAFVDRPLVRYRRHKKNQSHMFKHIQNKQDYYERRVFAMYALLQDLQGRNIHFKGERDVQQFALARLHRDIFQIWRYKRFNRKYAYFDILMYFIPDRMAEKMFLILGGK